MGKLIVSNLKNYMDTKDIVNYINKIDSINDQEVIICPSNIYIPYFIKKNFNVGIQNIDGSNKTITGEINPIQAKSLGIKYTLVGHSERRINLNENNSNINIKIIESHKNNINTILCIGETREQKELNETKNILKEQIDQCLINTDISKVIIAYEPIWAIGTNIIPTLDEIIESYNFIKDVIKKEFNYDVKVLYGGSVNEENIKKIIDIVDGVLIGKASTNIDSLINMIKVVRD